MPIADISRYTETRSRRFCSTMHIGPVRPHSTFRDQPSYKIFSSSFDDPDDALFQKLNEVDPYYLQEDVSNGFLEDEPIDPRTKTRLQYETYDHTDNFKGCRVFKGDGLKSALTKRQQDICLRVFWAWQEKQPVDESDLLIWRQLRGKIKREREQMATFIKEYAESHNDKIYASSKRLDALYGMWFKRKTNMLLQKYPDNLTYSTYTGMPHVSACKSIKDEKIEICDVQLLARKGWLRIHSEEDQIGWKNLNFKLEEYADDYNYEISFAKHYNDDALEGGELYDFGDREIGRNCYIPFETLLFLLTSGNYVDLPTECLLEICQSPSNDGKIIKFDSPFPARFCGWHTKQQVVEQAFTAFSSVKGRSKWLHVENEKVETEDLQTEEINGMSDNRGEFKPCTFRNFLLQYQTLPLKESNVKRNKALVKWSLKAPESVDFIKILTTFSLPPTLNTEAKEFQAHETIKLEYKPQFGCEIMTKYELLKIWLKMRLMSFTKTTNYGYCYRLSSRDCDIQLKERLTLDDVEHELQLNYHVNPVQLMANLAEFLKMMFNMPSGKYMLRYNSKYPDKFLLCAPTREISQNTIYLHSFLQADPTDMLFLTEVQYLPIMETLCSRVHLAHRIIPCAFLPQLPHQKNLQTADSRAKEQKAILKKKKAAAEAKARLKELEMKKVIATRRKLKRQRQTQRKRADQQKLREQESEINKLLDFK